MVTVTYANPRERIEVIVGLRTLAEFLEKHPDIPAPQCAYLMVFPDGDDDEMRAEIDRIAPLLKTTAALSHGHYRAVQRFASVEYRAVAIPNSGDQEGNVR